MADDSHWWLDDGPLTQRRAETGPKLPIPIFACRLQGFRVRQADAGNAAFSVNACDGAHDDLIFAVVLDVFWLSRPQLALPRSVKVTRPRR